MTWDVVEIGSIKTRIAELEMKVRHLEKIEDTRNTAWYRRLLFRADGWPRASVVATGPHERAWRPWHRFLPPA